jgi:uncharacterized membrane protein
MCFIHDLGGVESRLLWLNCMFLTWIAILAFPTGLLSHHPRQPVAIVLHGAICAIACLHRVQSLHRLSQFGVAASRYEDVGAFVDKPFCSSQSNTAIATVISAIFPSSSPIEPS